jgi:aminopeptidase N
MGSDLDTTAWTQIAGALATIEYAERGSVGHDAFAAYARSVLMPVFEHLGWRATPAETPDVAKLRQTAIRELGRFGDAAIIGEARRRFAAFVLDRKSIAPDDQATILDIVGQYADAATFESLHKVAQESKNETELRRYYAALMSVRDPELAQRAAQIALSPEIPAQADALRLQLIVELADEHQELSWKIFRDNSERLLQPFAANAPMIIAEYLPEGYWSGIPAADIETWVRAHVPQEMGAAVAQGMETVHFRVAEKDQLVAAADQYLRR